MKSRIYVNVLIINKNSNKFFVKIHERSVVIVTFFVVVNYYTVF